MKGKFYFSTKNILLAYISLRVSHSPKLMSQTLFLCPSSRAQSVILESHINFSNTNATPAKAVIHATVHPLGRNIQRAVGVQV
jgi:hypothetical protein